MGRRLLPHSVRLPQSDSSQSQRSQVTCTRPHSRRGVDQGSKGSCVDSRWGTISPRAGGGPRWGQRRGAHKGVPDAPGQATARLTGLCDHCSAACFWASSEGARADERLLEFPSGQREPLSGAPGTSHLASLPLLNANKCVEQPTSTSPSGKCVSVIHPFAVADAAA